MTACLWIAAVSAALGSDPSYAPNVGGGYVDPNYAGAASGPVVESGADPRAYGGEQRYPYDSPEPWLHGYIQEIPAYGGYVAFKPYNYKHVLSQSQAAGGWGLAPTSPYSHQFWHRYHAAAALRPTLTQRTPHDLDAEVARRYGRSAIEPVSATDSAEFAPNANPAAGPIITPGTIPAGATLVDPATFRRLTRLEELQREMDAIQQSLPRR